MRAHVSRGGGGSGGGGGRGMPHHHMSCFLLVGMTLKMSSRPRKVAETIFLLSQPSYSQNTESPSLEDTESHDTTYRIGFVGI